MADKETKLSIVVDAKNKTEQAFSSIKNSLGELEKQGVVTVQGVSDAMKKVGIAGTIAFGAIAVAVRDVVKGSAQVETIQKRLFHVLQTSSGASDDQVKALVEQAKALEKVGVVSASSIMVMQEEAASFDLSAEAIARLTPRANDFAVALYGINPSAEQARQAMTGLGKALQGQLELLTKKGYILDEDTIKMLENGTEMQKVDALVKVLGSNYENLNEEMRQTTEGGFVGMTFAISALKDALGTSLTPMIVSLGQSIEPIITKITAWIEENPKLVEQIVIVSGVIAGMMAVMLPLGLALPGIVLAFKGLATVFTFIATGPGFAITASIAGIAFAIIQIIKIVKILRNDWDSVWLGMKLTLLDMAEFVAKVFLFIPNMIIKAINVVVDAVNKILAKMANLPFVGKQFKKMQLDRMDELSLDSGIDALRSQAVDKFNTNQQATQQNNIVIQGNTLLDADSAESIGDMIIEKLKLSSNI